MRDEIESPERESDSAGDYIFSIFAFIATLVAFDVVPFTIPHRLPIAIVTASLSVVCSLRFISKKSYRVGLPRISDRIPKFWRKSIAFALLCMLFGLIVIYSNSSFYWLLPIIYPIAFILPGYLLIRKMGFLSSLKLGETYTISIIISVLICGSIGLAVLKFGAITVIPVAVLLASFVFIMFPFGSTRSTDFRKTKEDYSVEIDIIEATLYVLIFAFLFVVYFALHDKIFVSPFPLLSDEPFHVGYIVKFLTGYYTWQEVALGLNTIPGYPYLFHLALSVVSTMSDVGISTFFVLSSILFIPLPTIMFYELANTLLNDKKQAQISTVVFQIFSGAGWIFAFLNFGTNNDRLIILESSFLTHDIIFSTWLPIAVAPYLLDLAIFFGIINLSLKKSIPGRKLIILMALLITTSILSHVEKSLLLLVLFVIIEVVQLFLGLDVFKTREIGVSILISAAVVILWDFFAPLPLYTSLYQTAVSILVVGGALIVLLSFIRKKIPYIQVKIFEGGMLKIREVKIFIILACISMFVIDGVGVFGTSTGVVPLYAIAIKAGYTLPLVFLWFLHLNPNLIRRWSAFVILFSSILILDLGLYHTPLLLYNILGNTVEEFRFFRDIIWPMLAIAASLGLTISKENGHYLPVKIRLILIVNKRHYFFPPKARLSLKTKAIVLPIIIGLVFSTAGYSNLLKIEYQYGNEIIDESQYGFASYLGNMSVPNGSGLFATPSMVYIATASTGAVVYSYSSPVYGDIIAHETNLEGLLYTMKFLNISFIVTTESEIYGGLNIIVGICEILFQENDSIIYEIPAFGAPKINSETIIFKDAPIPSAKNINGVYGSFWEDDFDTEGVWDIYEPFSTNETIQSTDISITPEDTLKLSAIINVGNKSVLFADRTIANLSIPLDDEIEIWFRFRTRRYTNLVIQIVFPDDTSASLMKSDNTHFSSDTWQWISLSFKIHKPIVGIRIAISNGLNFGESFIEAEIDSLVITSIRNDSVWDTVYKLLALSSIRTTPMYNLNRFDPQNISTAILLDSDVNNTYQLDRIIENYVSLDTIVIVGALNSRSIVSSIVNITVTNATAHIDSILYDTLTFNIKSASMNLISISEAEVIAKYSGTNFIPFLIKFPYRDRDCYYLNILPVLEVLNYSDPFYMTSFTQIMMKQLLTKEMKIHSSESMERPFHIKNKGFITFEGEMNFSYTQVVFTNETKDWNFADQDTKILGITGKFSIIGLEFGFMEVVLEAESVIRAAGTENRFQEGYNFKILTSTISGSGNMSFASLFAGFPYSFSANGNSFSIVEDFMYETAQVCREWIFLVPLESGRGLN